jgi:hypothetical protein
MKMTKSYAIVYGMAAKNNETSRSAGYVRIEITESFPSLDVEKITKALVHCEERPAPHVTDNENIYIFSNSA